MSTRKKRVDWRGQVTMDHAPVQRVEPEASVLARVMRALEEIPGCLVMRNRIGYDKRARRHYGLGTGSSDVLCVVAPYGRVVWIETKRGDGGRVSDAQKKFIEQQIELGAVAGVCTSPEEAIALIERAKLPR